MNPGATRPGPLPGLRPEWSRVVDAPGGDGGTHTWHLLDNGVADPELTVLCVHGNPSWSYLWRRVLRDAPAGVRGSSSSARSSACHCSGARVESRTASTGRESGSLE